ncbi:chemotaxis protein CheW [Stenotrophomonas lactitubi]|uniref:chemotaxis protein CheW n=1 Tax=Stenotrophomonas lactitubi TaxID=2045214 RepID=UPI001D5025C3|nr:chemotaxis protein CheW [Stenotrophomonas lactitubi]CAH0193916.1 Chemotaxis protein CheW [Stenotrophomonas lactitubi]CAH0206557.1 Chemotaxis protein CheW [Stenotrophomonas lactitubi]CAH0224213.1 Chemotaxis protein CheW [Stenotrophomonas lactitubi]CAH0239969.1 Chemotaxis protein CheW [Stenotrophomonas lactitubi]
MQPSSPSAGEPAPSSPAFIEVVVVQAGTHLFAIDVDAAIEIRGPETFDRPGSGARPHLTVRGHALPVVDLRQATGLAAFAHGCPAILLMQASGETLALAVDEVRDIESVPRHKVQPATDTSFGFCSHHVTLGALGEVPLIDSTRLR